METPSNHLLRSLCLHSTMDLRAALVEREAEILEDIQTAREELEEGKPLKFTFSFRGTLDFTKSEIETAFTYSVRKSSKDSHSIADPNSPEFEFETKEDAE